MRQSARFSDWAAGQFETWQDSQKGSDAAAEIILPIAAAAVGMTAFAIVFHYATQHASTWGETIRDAALRSIHVASAGEQPPGNTRRILAALSRLARGRCLLPDGARGLGFRPLRPQRLSRRADAAARLVARGHRQCELGGLPVQRRAGAVQSQRADLVRRAPLRAVRHRRARAGAGAARASRASRGRSMWPISPSRSAGSRWASSPSRR